MTRYDRIQQILDQAVHGENIGGHRAFWRGLTRDQFVARSVFGLPLVALGNGAVSNLVKAFKGEAPFGADRGVPGAIFDRMPMGFPPVPDAEIAFIQTWINDGCPEDPWPPVDVNAPVVMDEDVQDEVHVAYWRDFDNWAMFNSTDEVAAAIDTFFNIASRWMTWARGNGSEADWKNAVAAAAVKDAVKLLGDRQAGTIRDHYGNPPAWGTVRIGYEKFGAGILPADPLRPQDPNHQMNGRTMWFFWSAFADAALETGLESAFWLEYSRAILLGIFFDGTQRGRFPVNGFPAGDPGKTAMRDFARQLADADVRPELRRRFADTGL